MINRSTAEPAHQVPPRQVRPPDDIPTGTRTSVKNTSLTVCASIVTMAADLEAGDCEAGTVEQRQALVLARGRCRCG